MNSDNDKICSLCLKTCNGDFEIIQDVTKEILEVLLVNMDFDISDDCVRCKKCSEMLEKCFEFKSICVHTEEKLIAYIELKKINKVNMTQVYLEGIPNNKLKLCNTEEICRFCMKPISNFVALDNKAEEYFSSMLQMFLPEMTLNITSNPVSCTNCLDSLKHYFIFLKYLQHVEEYIKNYSEVEITGGKVKLNNVTQHELKKISELCADKETIVKEEQSIEIYFSDLQQKNIRNVPLKGNMEEIRDSENYCLENIEKQDSVQKYIKREEIEIKMEEMNITFDNDNSEPTGVQEETKSIRNVVHDKETKINMDFRELVVKLKRENFNSCLHCGSLMKGKSSYEICEEANKSVVYKCRFCVYMNKTLVYVKRHVLKHREDADLDLFRCNRCILENKEKFKVIQCEHCEYSCKTEDDLKTHLLIHKKYKNNTRTFFCANCEFSTKHKRCLLGHMMKHTSEENIKKYKCKYCSHESIWRTHLFSHQMMHLKYIKDYKCDNCTFKTKYKHSLTTHQRMCLMKNSTDIDVFSCTQCSFATAYKHCLKQHMSRHTSKESVKEFKCNLCSYETNARQNLQAHHKKHHLKPEETKIYKCSDCLFQTKNNVYFGRHLKLCKSPSYKSRTCQKLEKSMNHDNNQTQSKETPSHPSKKEPKLFNCVHCEYKTDRNSALKLHLRVHKSLDEIDMYSCTKCKFVTKHKGCLKRHMGKHSSETVAKKYKCEHCSHRTHRSDEMKQHQLVHKSDYEMYKCEDCAFKTKYRGYFERHRIICKSKK